MNQQSGHLSDAQVEQYGNTVPPAEPGHDDREIEAHLADCGICRERVLSAQRIRFTLLAVPEMSSGPNARRPGSANPAGMASGPNCPDEDDLRNLAAGLLPPDQASRLVQHAAQCDNCGPLLRSYVADFSDEASDEDQALLAKLNSSSADWQKKLVTDSRASSGRSSAKSEKKSFPRRWVLAPAALAACAAIAFGVWYQQRETPEKVEKLLAEAYTAQRTIQMRWPGAAWGRMQVTLGSEDSRFSKPNSLLSAEEIISRKRATDPQNVAWLRAEAESEIIERHPGAAITSLNKALELQPESVPLRLDLSIAIVQQAQSSGDNQGYAKAIDLLTEITQSDPKNQPATFNLALTYSRLEMWDAAVTAWKAYLTLDPQGSWAEEARQQLQLAESKSKSISRGTSDISVTPAMFLDLPDSEVDFNSERYQDLALKNWLAPAMSDPGGREYRAVSRLAKIIRRKHSDSWLNDFLGPPAIVHDASGAKTLSAAMVANTDGHYLEAINYSSQAERSFQIQHNAAGVMRARYESVYANQRLLKGKDCVARASPIESEAASANYRWLQAQIAIERAICLNFIGKLSESDSELSAGLDIAEHSHYQVLVLRDIGMVQSLSIQRGKYDLAWDKGLRGLSAYWKGPAPVQRAYQFYAGLALSAEHKGCWSAAETLQSHAIEILDQDDQIQRGAALLELAKILAAEKHDDAAERVINEANTLLDRESREPTSRRYLLAGKIGLAELQSRNGRASEALSTLSPVRNLLSETDPYFISLNYYRTLGNIQLQLKCLDEAEQAFKASILIAEKSLSGLKSEQDRLQWIQASSDAYRGMVRALLEQHRDEAAFRLWEWYESRPSGDSWTEPTAISRSGPATWARLWTDLSKISWPGRQSNRVVFAVFDDGVQIWTIHEARLQSTWTAVRRERLELRVKDFVQNCARRDSSLAEVQAQGQELFVQLLRPILTDLSPNATVVIELDHSLFNLPVEALRSPEGWYFAEKYPVIYSPGLLGEARLRHPARIDPTSAVLLADSAGYLPGQELERETVSLRFPRTKIVGRTSDFAAFRTLLTGSDVFAFMGHGEPNGTGTALRVGPGMLLRAKDFSPRSLQRLRLAVLAACASGSSSENGLVDNRNLVHALVAGGVPSVVASGWDVDSETTGRLMAAFYAHAAEGETIDRALSVARNKCLKEAGHPYFWSAFRLVGRAY